MKPKERGQNRGGLCAPFPSSSRKASDLFVGRDCRTVVGWHLELEAEGTVRRSRGMQSGLGRARGHVVFLPRRRSVRAFPPSLSCETCAAAWTPSHVGWGGSTVRCRISGGLEVERSMPVRNIPPWGFTAERCCLRGMTTQRPARCSRKQVPADRHSRPALTSTTRLRRLEKGPF